MIDSAIVHPDHHDHHDRSDARDYDHGVGSTPNTEPLEEQIHAAIRSAGGRLTIPMRAVIAILLQGDGHPTADDLIAEVNRRITGIAPSTIYRVLSRLDELGIIEHVHSGTGPAFYQLQASSHVHLMCIDCGAIINVPEAAFAKLTKSVRAEYDFQLEPRHVAMLGRCRDCVHEHEPAGFHVHAVGSHRHR